MKYLTSAHINTLGNVQLSTETVVGKPIGFSENFCENWQSFLIALPRELRADGTDTFFIDQMIQ